MTFPSKEEFLKLAKDYNRVTVYKEIVRDIFHTQFTLLRNFPTKNI